ncbi:MAG: hypothetical protein NTX22_16180 [Ignavibacteriales bacterium]|nr:hypothetical protein [Ignavibacteriales bacterium]
MNWFKTNIFLLLFNFLGLIVINGQEVQQEKIALLPFDSNGIDTISVQTAESILRLEINKLNKLGIISDKRIREVLSSTKCIDSECALKVGKELGASQVFGCKLATLGEKIIIQYFLMNVSTGKQILIDQITASKVEDLEVVMKRIAKSVVDIEPITKGAEVGNIMANESDKSVRRSSKKNFGVSFGYLYPQNGYESSDRVFVLDGRFDYEIEDYAVGMLIGIRKGFAMNIYSSYLFSRKDICPYIGGGFGFHWVSHSDGFIKKKADGFELTANTGIRILHTYSVQIVFNLELILTLNDYNDKAIVFTLGIL